MAYRELSEEGIKNLSFIQVGDRFDVKRYTFEIGERVEDDTHLLINLTTTGKGKCHLNEVLDRVKLGVYTKFRRVYVRDLNPDDLIFSITHSRYFTVLSTRLSNCNEVMVKLKDSHSRKDIEWTEKYILEQINKDKFKLISNTTNNNEKTSVINTDLNREGEPRAITSSTTRLITSSSRLVGNAKASAIKTTRTCSFKISQNSISY